jgi:hypothetical protein
LDIETIASLDTLFLFKNSNRLVRLAREDAPDDLPVKAAMKW